MHDMMASHDQFGDRAVVATSRNDGFIISSKVEWEISYTPTDENGDASFAY